MTSPYIEIEGRKIGPEFVPLVIAEIGINHNGDLNLAKELVDRAVSAGAEVIKHQTHVVEDEMTLAADKVIPAHTSESIYQIMKSCALNEEDEIELKKYVESKGAIFISTPFSRAAANRLERMGVTAYKIGSGECNNIPLIKHVASFGKPMIVSTGMNDIESVEKTVSVLREYKVPYALLHCTNVYPTPSHLVRLGAMTQLEKKFPDAVIGLSDHTTSNLACFAAIGMGASILERHFTDRMDRKGPDIINSMDPVALCELIYATREIFKMRGGEKGAVAEEKATIDFAFATVVSIQDMKKGSRLSMENVWVKRPGIGEIPASDLESLLGKTITRDINSGEHLCWSDLE